MPDGATPRVEFDETLMRAIEAGRLDPAQAADRKLAGAFAAHQKLESLFALLRGEGNNPLSLRERARVRADESALGSAGSAMPADEPPPERLGRYLVVQPPSAGAVHASIGRHECYQLAMLAFERLLWLCGKLQGGAVGAADIRFDSVLRVTRERLPAATEKLRCVLDSAESDEFRADLHRLDDTRRFVECASSACPTSPSLADELLSRHADVQRGRFDRGRRKMPWIEKTAGRVALTMTRVGGLHFEATDPEEIAPHPYRLASADALIAAANMHEKA